MISSKGSQTDTQGSLVDSHGARPRPAVAFARKALRIAFTAFLDEALGKGAAFGKALAVWSSATQKRLSVIQDAVESLSGDGHSGRSDLLADRPPSDAGELQLERLPVGLLFTEGDRFGETPDQTPEWLANRAIWSDLPLARLRPHLSLFDFFLQRGPYPEEYIRWHQSTLETRGYPPDPVPQLLERRHRQFQALESRLQAGTFGDDLSVQVEYNPGGYFNLRDGHHRASYLLCRGWRTVPARLSLSDHLRWAPLDKQRAVLEEIERTQRTEIYTPILAPLFYDRPAERDTSGPTRLETILRYLGPTRLTSKRVLDIGSNTGFYAQHFTREGAIVTGVEPDPKHIRLAHLLNALFGIRYELRQERFDACDLPPHDIGLMLTVFYHFAGDQALRGRFLERLRTSVKDMLFWESGDDPETEKRLLIEGTHLKRYQQLGSTFGTGKHRELGVFRAERE